MNDPAKKHLRQPVIAIGFCIVTVACAIGQAVPAASRVGDLQAGGGYVNANSNYEYVTNRIAGAAVYTTFDFKRHIGAELDFHQVKDPNSAVYQRTYEAGARYFRHYGLATPYMKAEYGRGVLNYPKNVANLAYNILAAGVGVDLAIQPRLSVRVEFEYQDWLSAPGAGITLNPTLFTIGCAYHFGSGGATTLKR